MPVHLILLGPPGVGKSTQASLLRQRYPIEPLATGALLRAEVEAGTPLGRQAQAIIARGQLVDDAIMIAMVRQRLAALPPEQGFLLDGFPRTIGQAVALDGLLHELGRPLTVVLQPLVEREDVVRRLAARRECRVCATPVQLQTQPLTACPRCGGELVQRADDTPEVILQRIRVYEQQTAPLVEYYRGAGLLAPVDGRGTPQEVAERLCAVIEGRSRRAALPRAVEMSRALGA